MSINTINYQEIICNKSTNNTIYILSTNVYNLNNLLKNQWSKIYEIRNLKYSIQSNYILQRLIIYFSNYSVKIDKSNINSIKILLNNSNITNTTNYLFSFANNEKKEMNNSLESIESIEIYLGINESKQRCVIIIFQYNQTYIQYSMNTITNTITSFINSSNTTNTTNEIQPINYHQYNEIINKIICDINKILDIENYFNNNHLLPPYHPMIDSILDIKVIYELYQMFQMKLKYQLNHLMDKSLLIIQSYEMYNISQVMTLLKANYIRAFGNIPFPLRQKKCKSWSHQDNDITSNKEEMNEEIITMMLLKYRKEYKKLRHTSDNQVLEDDYLLNCFHSLWDSQYHQYVNEYQYQYKDTIRDHINDLNEYLLCIINKLQDRYKTMGVLEENDDFKLTKLIESKCRLFSIQQPNLYEISHSSILVNQQEVMSLYINKDYLYLHRDSYLPLIQSNTSKLPY